MLESLRHVLEVAGDAPVSPAELRQGAAKADAELADARSRLEELEAEFRAVRRTGAEEEADRLRRELADTRRQVARWRAARSKLAELLDERTEIEV